MKKGKHEAGGSWQKGGDPFAEEIQPKVSKKAGPKVKKAKAGGRAGERDGRPVSLRCAA